ncbi:MAG: protein-methionine-sulfoxide reductase heme-binding subunit MsrQ, partial [Myxococcota bacterium]|nr:protein-methionine-sulfoxide reductase heme-binding subunit MsrQ [Myxococcota bacterium]
MAVDPDRRRWIHAAVVGIGLLPAIAVIVQAPFGGLGPNPVETLTHVTGEWGLRFLILSLAVTPLRRLLGWPALAPYRRTFGLLAFGYVVGHFSVYLALDLGFDFSYLAEDVLERPYITAGFAAFCSLLPLAVTSTRSWQRRLGRRWVSLHRLTYLAIGLALLHYLWLVKA